MPVEIIKFANPSAEKELTPLFAAAHFIKCQSMALGASSNQGGLV